MECPDLIPTLDRNNIIPFDRSFIALKLALKDLIIKKLADYAKGKSEQYKRILESNIQMLQAALVLEVANKDTNEGSLFYSLINYLPFRTTMQVKNPNKLSEYEKLSKYIKGKLITLEDYRQEFSPTFKPQSEIPNKCTKDKIYYLHEPQSYAQYETIAIKKGLPVLLAHLDEEKTLIDAYGETFKNDVDVQEAKEILS